jgi:hypothetical protein
MNSKIDWRKPMLHARSEDLTQEIDGIQDDRNAHAIQWHLGAEEYERVQRMEACYQCLTTFPAPPSRENMRYWVEAEKAGYTHIRGKAVAHRLIREGRCPLCCCEISAAALGHNDMGENPMERDARLHDGMDLREAPPT